MVYIVFLFQITGIYKKLSTLIKMRSFMLPYLVCHSDIKYGSVEDLILIRLKIIIHFLVFSEKKIVSIISLLPTTSGNMSVLHLIMILTIPPYNKVNFIHSNNKINLVYKYACTCNVNLVQRDNQYM